MKIDIRNKKGFTTVDLTIAMVIMVIFVVIMTSISYNVYSASMEAKRTAVALNYVVDIFEYIGTMNYGDVDSSMNLLNVEELKSFELQGTASTDNVDIITGKIGTYNIEIRIEDYRNGQVIKIITVTITYPVSRKKTETMELQRAKTISNLNQEAGT